MKRKLIAVILSIMFLMTTGFYSVALETGIRITSFDLSISNAINYSVQGYSFVYEMAGIDNGYGIKMYNNTQNTVSNPLAPNIFPQFAFNFNTSNLSSYAGLVFRVKNLSSSTFNSPWLYLRHSSGVDFAGSNNAIRLFNIDGTQYTDTVQDGWQVPFIPGNFDGFVVLDFANMLSTSQSISINQGLGNVSMIVVQWTCSDTNIVPNFAPGAGIIMGDVVAWTGSNPINSYISAMNSSILPSQMGDMLNDRLTANSNLSTGGGMIDFQAPSTGFALENVPFDGSYNDGVAKYGIRLSNTTSDTIPAAGGTGSPSGTVYNPNPTYILRFNQSNLNIYEGIVLRVKNIGSGTFNFLHYYVRDSLNNQTGNASRGTLLYNLDGTPASSVTSAWQIPYIPAGFDGYIVVPFDYYRQQIDMTDITTNIFQFTYDSTSGASSSYAPGDGIIIGNVVGYRGDPFTAYTQADKSIPVTPPNPTTTPPDTEFRHDYVVQRMTSGTTVSSLVNWTGPDTGFTHEMVPFDGNYLDGTAKYGLKFTNTTSDTIPALGGAGSVTGQVYNAYPTFIMNYTTQHLAQYEGIVMRIKNVGTSDFGFLHYQMRDSSTQSTDAPKLLTLYDLNGFYYSEANQSSWNNPYIPAGFDGYAVIPFNLFREQVNLNEINTNIFLFYILNDSSAPTNYAPGDGVIIGNVVGYTQDPIDAYRMADTTGTPVPVTPATRTVNSPELTLEATDYTYMWWANGYRDTSASRRLNIMSGKYGLSIDPYNLSITNTGAFATHISQNAAGYADNSMISSLPAQSNSFSAKLGSNTYSATTAPDGVSGTDPISKFMSYNYRVIESGRFAQGFDIINFPLSSSGSNLSATGHLEIHALPDYYSLLYELFPTAAMSGVEMSFTWTIPSSYTSVTWSSDNKAITVKNPATGDGLTFVSPSQEYGTPVITKSGNVLTFTLSGLDFSAPVGEPYSNVPYSEPYGHRKGFNIFVIPSSNAQIADANIILGQQNSLKYSASEVVTPIYENQYPIILGSNTESNDSGSIFWNPTYGDLQINMYKAFHSSLTDIDRSAQARISVTLQNPTASPMKVPVTLFRQNTADGKISDTSVIGATVTLRQVNADGTPGEPLGIPVQLSKNWHADYSQFPATVYQGYWQRFTTLITIPANTTVDYELTLNTSLWGGVNSVSYSQLSLIGWGFNDLWISAALGSYGESICFEPEGIQCDGASIDDWRPVTVTGTGGTQWNWTENFGGAALLTASQNGSKLYQSRVKTNFIKYGPNITETTINYVVGNAINVSHTAYLIRTDDMVRVYNKMRYDVTSNISLSRLALFQLGADYYNVPHDQYIAYGNSDGLLNSYSLDSPTPANTYKTLTGTNGKTVAWTGTNRWATLYNSPSANSAAGADRTMILRSWNAVINGQSAQPYLASYGTNGGNSNNTTNWELTVQGGGIDGTQNTISLLEGDYAEFVLEMILTPQNSSDYYGPQTALINRMIATSAGESAINNWKHARFCANGGAISVTAGIGTLTSTYPIKITASNDAAQFSITGGMGYVPVTIEGLSSAAGWHLQVISEGEWIDVDQSVHGNDFWQCDYNADNDTYSLTYNVFANADGTSSLYRLTS